MYLFQQEISYNITQQYSDLHSTMYLFQLNYNELISVQCSFTFHYVSISTNKRPLEKLPHKFTFHYVSISTLMNTDTLTTILIFTFHYVSISTSISGAELFCALDLHSTMYLFQLQGMLPAFLSPFVFTFHYVSISTLINESNVIFNSIFTFHYVSISTVTVRVIESVSNKFTFHYVSISTFKKILGIHSPSNLHSTMYLFQRDCINDFQFVGHIYIPLCIYFNDIRYYNIILRRIIYIPLCIYFNSHKSFPVFVIVLIYIPLCIYFNSLHMTSYPLLLSFTFHYVSISTHMTAVHCNLIRIYIPLCIYFNFPQ